LAPEDSLAAAGCKEGSIASEEFPLASYRFIWKGWEMSIRFTKAPKATF
jgi:hypothetical protein